MMPRIRRVKCDEAKPQCHRCVAARRICDGYLPAGQVMSRRQMLEVLRSTPVVGPASEVLALRLRASTPGPSSSSSSSPAPVPRLPPSPPSSPRDAVFFDYFRTATAPSTDAFIPSAFWGRDLLQLAHAEPAVWHATVAVGALHQRWELQAGQAGAETERAALASSAARHYGRALSLARTLGSATRLLALCLPLTAAANMLGFWGESHVHILSGFRILAQNRGLGASDEARRLSAVLARLDMQSITFSDTSSPYPDLEAWSIQASGQDVSRQNSPFLSYSQAAATLFSLMRRLMVCERTSGDGAIDAATQLATRQDLTSQTELFEVRMAEFEARCPSSLDELAAVSIRIYHAWHRFILQAHLFGDEARFDEYTAHFQHLATLVHLFVRRRGTKETLELSLEPAVVAPLFDAAKRCRHPALRRHMLLLMRGLNRHEGMWRSDAAAATLQRVMETEEEGLGDECERVASACHNYCADEEIQAQALAVPWIGWSFAGHKLPLSYTWDGISRIHETRRVGRIKVAPGLDSRVLELKFLMSSGDSTHPYGAIKDVSVHY